MKVDVGSLDRSDPGLIDLSPYVRECKPMKGFKMARSNLQEVQNETNETNETPQGATVAERLAQYVNAVAYDVPLSLTDGMVVPVVPRFAEGETITLSADMAAFFSSAYLSAAVASGERKLASDDWKDKEHSERQTMVTTLVNGGFVIPSASKNRDFSGPRLLDVVDELVFRLGQEQGKYPATAKYADQTDVARKGREGVVTKILTDPTLADKYTSRVESLIAEKLAGRPVKVARQKKNATEIEAVDPGIEI